MKNILCCFILCPVWSWGQFAPVSWTVHVRPVSVDHWLLKVSIQMKPGWHVYGQKDSIYGLEPLQIRVKATEGTKEDNLVPTLPLQFREDPLFDHTLQAVYSHSLQWEQLVHTGDNIGGCLRLVLSGQASNDEEFVPLQLEQEVKLGNVFMYHPLWILFLLGFGSGALTLLTPLVMPIISTMGISRMREREKARGMVGILDEEMNRKPGRESMKRIELGHSDYHVRTVPGRRLGMLRVVNGHEGVFMENERERERERVWRKKVITMGSFFGGIFMLISMAAIGMFNAKGWLETGILQTMTANAWVNVFFSGVFVFFALLFFRFLKTPKLPLRSIKETMKIDLGNMARIFILVLLLTIVSIFCTASMLGAVPIGAYNYSNSSEQMKVGMSGSALAMALPFVLLAMFPDWLKYLPKSGENMEAVKKSIAYVHLAIALCFLWRADQAKQWGLLNREVILGVLLVLSLALGIYLIGLIDQFRNWGKKKILQQWKVLMVVENEPEPLPLWRTIMGSMVLLLAFYLGYELVRMIWGNGS